MFEERHGDSMNKALNKVAFKCIMYTFILSLPFVVLHYFANLNYMKNGSGYFAVILEIIQLVCTVVLAVIIRKRNNEIIKENRSMAGRYNIIFSAAFLLVLILYLTNTLRHIFFVFFHDTSRFNAFVYVFLERMLRGELLAEIMLCLTICFFGNSFRLQVKNQVQ